MSPAGNVTPGEKAALLARLREFEGVQVAPPSTARDPVNRPMIHHWCDAVGDDNPVYLDEEAAAASVHGGIVAPPAMLQAWAMPGLRPPPGALDTELRRLLAILAEAGFTSVVATNYTQEYLRYLRPGDVLSEAGVIDSVSEEKGTGLGPGHFVTTSSTYRDQHGEVVGTSTMRILLYRPAQATPPPAGGEANALPGRMRPPFNRDTAFFWEGVAAGELRIQHCASCGALRHPPRPMCHLCRSLEWDFVVSTGRGAVHSYVVYHRPAFPPFEYPHVIGLVDLEEGTRLVANIVDVDPAEVEIGMPVECRCIEVEDGLVLPQFFPRPAP